MVNAVSRILIVEDVLKNVQLLGSVLKPEGYALNIARDGVQALSILEHTKPDLILLDLSMPNMDGFEACKRIKANPETCDIPVVFLTARVEQEDIVKGFEAGAVDYVTKPFNAAELLQRVKTHLSLRQKSIQLEENLRQINKLREKEKEYRVYIETENERLDTLVNERTKEIQAARMELQSALEQLNKLDLAKDDFLNLISHELKTPLNGMLAVEMILSGDITDPDDMAELRDMFNVSYKKLLTIVDHAAILTAIKVGKVAKVKQSLEFSSLAETAVQQAQDFAKSRESSIELIPGEEQLVYCDARSINIALVALLETAARFSNGTESVKATWGVNDHELGFTMEAIGYTIPEESLGKVFDVLSIGKALFPGGDIGLGPAVARQVLSIHGGRVLVENIEDRGIRLTAGLSTRIPETLISTIGSLASHG